MFDIETTVEQAQQKLGVSKEEAVAKLKELERDGHGRFVIGRRGKKSRWVPGAVRSRRKHARRATSVTDFVNKKRLEEAVGALLADYAGAIARKVGAEEDIIRIAQQIITRSK